MKKGYSLIELTIVVGLISILSIAISAIVLSTIVNSNRIRTQVRIRQAGDYAIGQMNTMIRNSRGISTCSAGSNSVTITNQDHNTTQFSLATDQIASNSGVYLTPDDLAVTNFSLTCEPTNSPRLINVAFTIGLKNTTGLRSAEKPTQTFSTAIEVRND